MLLSVPEFYLPPNLLQYVAYAVIFRSHARLNPQLSTPTAVVVIFFYSRVFHLPLNLNIFSQKHIYCDLLLYKRTFRESSKTFSIITTKSTLIVMIHLFASVPRTSHS